MQVFALGILVVQIAERDGKPELAPFYLGLMGLARAVPGIPCTLIAGAVADRVDRRRILFVTQTTMALTALVLAVLAYVGLANLGALLVNAISFLAILGALFVIPRIPPAAQPSHGLLHSVLEGGRYVRRSPVLLWIITIAGTGFVWAGPAGALLPALAGESVFNGVSWLSLLLSAFGAGSFTAAFFVMNVGKIRSLGTIFVGAAMLNGVFLILFALTSAPLAALAFAFVTGLGGTLMAGMGNNMLQATTDDAYRGRVMSLWGLLFIGLMPVGQLALGALGSLFGIHAALAFGGIITLAAGIYAAVRLPMLREWRRPTRRVAPAVPAVTIASPGVGTSYK